MPSFQLTRKAKNDLRSIGRDTKKRWGLAQRNRYLARLDECFYMLAETPNIGPPCDYIKEGYRKYHVGRHFIFYRRDGDLITIIRILHDRMDVEAHLSDG